MRCKWFDVCPLRRFEAEGKISLEWRRRYCEGDFTRCRRYQLEEKGIPHSDYLMPDGTYLKR
ncbi:uracil-DNA glycosylase [Candidatus Micrarchaeota archaeon]|nr:uracil-DNA glycosylase [Candidatus Micrarchaeota archaeon]